MAGKRTEVGSLLFVPVSYRRCLDWCQNCAVCFGVKQALSASVSNRFGCPCVLSLAICRDACGVDRDTSKKEV
jgi:hypothetical protein